MKVTGKKREDGTKDYEILHDGVLYDCIRQENQSWKCRGEIFKSIKDLKEAISSGHFAPTEELIEKANSSWDCVDPCAHVVMLLSTVDDLHPLVLETLDNYGWLDEKGKPDREQAERHYKAATTKQAAVGVVSVGG